MASPNVEPAPLPASPSSYPLGLKGDRQALVQMQRVLWARVQNPQTPAHIAAQCARAWRDLQDMKRIMDGKPLPGQLRPDLDQKKSKRRPALLSMPELPKESLNPPGGGGGVGVGGL